jgi:AraC-like DNA-binding protein
MVDSIELNYFINSSECQVFPDDQGSFMIYIKLDHSYFNNTSTGFPFKYLLSQSQSVCCNTQWILSDLINTEWEGVFREMHIESKILDLVLKAYEVHLDQNSICSQCRFLRFDYNKEKIQQARQVLLDQLNNPPTIPELSKLLGINQCYLKKGFKEMYQMTIYDFVQEQRMELAKGMMRNSSFSLTEISDSLGFSSSGSFSKAYKKIHGHSPGKREKSVAEKIK